MLYREFGFFTEILDSSQRVWMLHREVGYRERRDTSQGYVIQRGVKFRSRMNHKEVALFTERNLLHKVLHRETRCFAKRWDALLRDGMLCKEMGFFTEWWDDSKREFGCI